MASTHSASPLYGCLTGIELNEDSVDLSSNVRLRRVFVDTFGTTLMAFDAPPEPNAPHPTPWAAVHGGFMFESRVQLEIDADCVHLGLTPPALAWLIASVLRTRMGTPVRLAVVSDRSFEGMKKNWRSAKAFGFENAHHLLGTMIKQRKYLGPDDIEWLRTTLPSSVRLAMEARFSRAFAILDQARWSTTHEAAMMLIWTAVETLFDLGGEREKTKAVSRALSTYVSANKSARDRSYQVISRLYSQRSSIAHAGKPVALEDLNESFRFASAAFHRVLTEGVSPRRQPS